jgi:hypothetical protein
VIRRTKGSQTPIVHFTHPLRPLDPQIVAESEHKNGPDNL